MILIGYSGHAYVAYGIIQSSGGIVSGYCDQVAKSQNPFKLPYLGTEEEEVALQKLAAEGFFIAIGDNDIRKKVADRLSSRGLFAQTIIHPSAVIATSASISNTGVMIGAAVVVNPLAEIEEAVILNTGAIIEHECRVGAYVHIAPGAVLCGNVKVGRGSFIGAGSVIRQGISIGANCMVAAGSVVVKDIPDNSRVMGVPASAK